MSQAGDHFCAHQTWPALEPEQLVAEFLRIQDRSDARMRNDLAAAPQVLLKLDRAKVFMCFDILANVFALAHLRDHWLVQLRRYAVNGFDQPVKRKLGANGQKDHNTLPA